MGVPFPELVKRGGGVWRGLVGGREGGGGREREADWGFFFFYFFTSHPLFACGLLLSGFACLSVVSFFSFLEVCVFFCFFFGWLFLAGWEERLSFFWL